MRNIRIDDVPIERMKVLLNNLHQNICIQKEIIECIIEELNEYNNEPTNFIDEPRQLIKGLRGLAEFLGCSITKAQAIINTGILQKNEIAYRSGNRWRIDKNLLIKLLQNKPDILK